MEPMPPALGVQSLNHRTIELNSQPPLSLNLLVRKAGIWDLGHFAVVPAPGKMSSGTRKYKEIIRD